MNLNNHQYIDKLNYILVCCFLLTFVISCMELKQPYLSKTYYNLEIEKVLESAPTKSKPIINKTLKIRKLDISPDYRNRELVYKKKNYIFESDFYNLFFIYPSAMITQNLRQWITNLNLFSNVIIPSSIAQPDYILEGIINYLYGDYSSKQPQAIVAMQFNLIDANSANNSIIFSKTYKQELPISNNTSEALVKAYNIAIKNIFSKLTKDLKKKLINK